MSTEEEEDLFKKAKSMKETPVQQRWLGGKRLLCVILTVIICLVVIGAVVTGVLLSRRATTDSPKTREFRGTVHPIPFHLVAGQSLQPAKSYDYNTL